MPGTTLVIGPDTPNEETVVVKLVVDPGAPSASFTFDCVKGHLAGERVICRSNMGPWPRYDPRNDPKVVPYFSIID